MTNFEFGSEKRLSRLTLARAEKLNALFAEIAAMSETKISFTINGDIDADGGKIINAANGTDPQDLVTKAQLDATAFAPALPGQTGNAGRFITTDGTNASWADAPVRFDIAQLLSGSQQAQARANIAAAGSAETTTALGTKADAAATTAALATKADASAVAVALAEKASLTGVETLTNKTLTAPVVNAPQGQLLRGTLHGLSLSNNVSDANNDIDIAAGAAGSDGATPALMVLASAITKRLDASWAVGNNNGGLDTGAKGNNTWYYLWLIQRSDTGVVDVLFSTSATAPTMPVNYDRKRRLPGAVRTDGSGNIRAFNQRGARRFEFVSRITDVNASNPGASAVLRTMTVPPNMLGIFEVQISAADYLGLTNPAQTDVSIDSSAGFTLVTSGRGATQAVVSVNGSSQIRSRMNNGSAVTLTISTLAFEDLEF
jgi:hypothetical protein